MKRIALLFAAAALLAGCVSYHRTVESQHYDPITGTWVTDSKKTTGTPW